MVWTTATSHCLPLRLEDNEIGHTWLDPLTLWGKHTRGWLLKDDDSIMFVALK